MHTPTRPKKPLRARRRRQPLLCDTCGNPLRWEPGLRSWGMRGYWFCDHGCFACAFCAQAFCKDGHCADCHAALCRESGPHFCGCGAPMIAKGWPVLFICKNGCAVCPDCEATVAFGASCEICKPRPFGPPEFDEDLPC